jgi:hypothetical protein
LGVLINKKDFSDSEIGKIFFVDHSGVAFDLVKSDKLCRFKYSNDELLIDKLCVAFKDALLNGDDNVFYYRKLIFCVLTNGYSYSKKIDEVIDDFEKFLRFNFSHKHSLFKEIRKCIECLINELRFYKQNFGKKRISENDDKILKNSFGIKDSYFIDKISKSSYSCIGVPKQSSKQIVTMDSKVKTTYDDAISIRKNHEGYLLSIFISDVASYVMNCPELYDSALQRGGSIYLKTGNNHIQMFPESVRRFFSLVSGENRYVLGHFFQLSNDFDFIASCVRPVKIKISKNYTFDQADRILKGKINDSNRYMFELLKAVSDKYESQFNLKYHSIKEETDMKDGISSTSSHIIEVLSLFLNSYIANTMSEKKYPFIYRINNSDLNEDVIGKSFYSSKPMGHVVNYGNCYGQITNPIRNAVCLLNQYFEIMMLVDDKYKVFGIDKQSFIEYWNCELPTIVSDLNKRLFLNSEYSNAVDTICSTNRVKQSKDRQKILTR